MASRYLIILSAAILAGCESEDILCPPLPDWAVAVDVRDSVTDARLLAGARGAVHASTRVDSLRRDRISLFPDSVLVGGTVEGVVEVRVEHPGYQPWTASGVRTRLEGSPCATWDTQALTARLQPQ
jgi:hypothetical protein